MILYIFYIITIIGSLYYLYQARFPNQITLKSPENTPKVSIVVPARNEEENIKRCLKSLSELNYDNKEIILVDGNSKDRTVEIAQQINGVTIVEEPPRPEGWVGKPWACYQGYQHSNGEILLFTDADTWHTSQSLHKTVAELKQSNGFLSLLTTQELQSFWEHMLTIVFLIISITVRGTKGTKRAQIANGQYMMFTRERYEQLGTHQVVAGSIIEDLALGTHGSKQGYPPKIVAQRNLVTARMYRNLAEIKEGFGKNLALGVKQTGIDSMIGAGLFTTWALGWIVLLIIDFVQSEIPSLPVIALCFGGYGMFATILAFTEYQISTKLTPYVLIFPIYYVVFIGIVSISIIQTFIRKEIEWKDQKYTIE